MPPVEIRRATDEDINSLGEAHVRAWQWAYRGLMPDEVLDGLDPRQRAVSWNRLIHKESAPRPHLAVVDSKVVGFSHADTSRDQDADPRTGEVTSLYLLKEYLGSGIGRRLWEAAVEQLQATGHAVLSVWVLETNLRGRHFYERQGMALDGATKQQTIGGSTLTEIRYRSVLDD
jgi:ribosomal protein S18 acetylase RimI-like enzyme